MIETHHGCTRFVILIGKLAIKIPQFHYEWRHFLQGLLANMQERQFWTALKADELCPILWGSKKGWIVIMRRAEPMTREQFDKIDLREWLDRGDWKIPAEPKMDSFGWIEGRLVAVDYGGFL